jgi:hypothetical protein
MDLGIKGKTAVVLLQMVGSATRSQSLSPAKARTQP